MINNCTITGCTRKPYMNDICKYHFYNEKPRKLVKRKPIVWAKCQIKSCTKIAVSKQLCRSHYQAQYRIDYPNGIKEPNKLRCEIEGCDRPQLCHGVCRKHYNHMRVSDQEQFKLKQAQSNRPHKRPKSKETICNVPICNLMTSDKSKLCSKHLTMLRNGTIKHELRDIMNFDFPIWCNPYTCEDPDALIEKLIEEGFIKCLV